MLDFIAGAAIGAGLAVGLSVGLTSTVIAATAVSMGIAVAGAVGTIGQMINGKVQSDEAKKKAEEQAAAEHQRQTAAALQAAGQQYAQTVETKKHAASAIGDGVLTAFGNRRELEDQSGIKDRKVKFIPTAAYPSGHPAAR